ncbi:MAG: hypothetical protein ABL984_11960 [Pyrinomonadaceae bacterium]
MRVVCAACNRIYNDAEFSATCPHDSSQFDRHAVLTRTPEQKAEDKQLQEESRERLEPLVTDSVAVAQYRNAVGAEPGIRESIEIGYNQLAESLFWQGRFLHAMIIAESNELSAEYRAYRDAFNLLDAPLCQCPSIMSAQPGSAKGVARDPRREVQRVFIGDLQKEVRFILCEGCKKLFAQTT